MAKHGRSSDNKGSGSPKGSLGEVINDLVLLISRRLLLMPTIAKVKWVNQEPVDAPDREKQIINSLAEQCEMLEVPSESIIPFMEGIIEASKQVQHACIEIWAQESHDFPDSKPLNELRAEVDKINRQLVNLLSADVFQAKGPELTQQLFLELSARLSVSLSGQELVNEKITSLLMNGALKAFIR